MRTELGMLVRTWLIVVLFAAVTIARSVQVDIPLRDPGGAFFFTRIEISLGVFVVLVLLDGVLSSWRARGTWRYMLALVAARWSKGRMAMAITGLLAFHLVYVCYHNLKSWDVLNAPRD